MSQINVNTIKDKTGTGAPNFPTGATVTGVVTATSFAGNVTGNVTGALTGNATSSDSCSGNSATASNLTGTPNITVGTIGCGSVTGTTGTFSGNVSVGGTLTYDDVTNVDSVGLITARNGVHVTAGVSTFANSIDGASYEGNFVLDSYLFG